MKYRVIGIRRAGGQEVDQEVEAKTAANAAGICQQAGIVVTGVFDEEGKAHPFPLLDFSQPSAPAPVYQTEKAEKWSPGVAVILSFFVPGLGQMYKGQIFNGLVWLFATVVGYFFLIIPGLILHLFCLAGAYSGDPTKRG